jgi:DNA-binding response OmpR family regulator
MQTLPKLLLVEDNRNLARALYEALQTTYDIDIASTGKAAIYKTDISFYDVIVLDYQLPDMQCIDVCQQLRERDVSTPILTISTDTKPLTKITMLDAGANDYLTKPFSLGELKARLRVLTRNPHRLDTTSHRAEIYQVDDLILNSIKHEVRRGDMLISLRKKEFLLLECLMRHAGMVVSRDTLMRYAWQGSERPWANTIDVHIKYLRDKIDRPFTKPLIITVHGLGYKMPTTITKEQAIAETLASPS